MNTTQVALLLAPGCLFYLFFVLSAKVDGRINRWANLFSGLIVTPLLMVFIPFILLGVCLNALKNHKWREGLVTLCFLVLIVGYCVLIVLVGDGVPPSPVDLPVER